MKRATPESKDILNPTETIEYFGLSRRKFYSLLSEKKKHSFIVLYGSRKLIIKAGFEKYAEFFCLNGSWVENGKVLNLLYNDENKDKTGRNAKTLDEWNFSQEPLPNSAEWWTFYCNIMNRLDARNEQIKEVIEGK